MGEHPTTPAAFRDRQAPTPPTTENGEEVWVCEYHRPPRSGHYGDTGSWHVAGVVRNLRAAAAWERERPDDRRVIPSTLGIVSDRP